METWLEIVAERFWASPVMVARLPRPGVFGAERWLSRYGPHSNWGAGEWGSQGDRQLRACLVAAEGNCCILLDAGDPPDEQRYSLAHEVAHFILEYQQPRQRAQRRLGDSALAVLDGQRPAGDTAASAARRSARLAGMAGVAGVRVGGKEAPVEADSLSSWMSCACRSGGRSSRKGGSTMRSAVAMRPSW